MLAAPLAPTTAQRRNDLILAAVFFVGAVLSAALSSIAQVYGDEQAPAWTSIGYALVIAGALAVRRRWPSIAAVVVALAYFVAVTIRVPEIFVGNIAMFICLYTVGAWLVDRRRAMLVRVGIIIGMFIWLIVIMYQDATSAADDAHVVTGAMSPYLAYMLLQVLLNMLYFGGAYYFGERAWIMSNQRAALRQRTEDLEREREVTAAQAVALDRVRIARELHDVVAHHVSVMGVQAGAARLVVSTDPGAAQRMLENVEDSARTAITELRQLLETLRDQRGNDPEDASTVTLADIAGLADASTEAGLPTTFVTVGTPFEVSTVVAVNLYRIAQESLTNARRHAGVGATADVRVRYLDDAVELEVINTGRMVTRVVPGLGQQGMRERALASGGSIELAPRESGGYLVRVRVPLARAEVSEPPLSEVNR